MFLSLSDIILTLKVWRNHAGKDIKGKGKKPNKGKKSKGKQGEGRERGGSEEQQRMTTATGLNRT
jgi:hypothetical protein